MSPKQLKDKLREVSLLRISAAVGALVIIAGAFTAPFDRAVTYGDHRYVRRDTFFVYQQSVDKTHALDSLVHKYEIEKLNATAAGVDTIKQCLRHPSLRICQ